MDAIRRKDQDASARRAGASFFILLAVVLGLALFLRAWNLDGPSLWEDELLTLDRASMPLGRMFQVQKYQGPADTIFDLQPPLIYAAVHGALSLSDTTLAARGVSAAAGVLGVLGFYLLGSLTAGRRTGLLAACLCAVSLYHMEASRSIKHYALFICLSQYSLYFCLRFLRSGLNRTLCAFGLCSAGMIYVGYQGIVLLAGMGAASACALYWGGTRTPGEAGRKLWRMAAAAVLVAAVCLPIFQAAFFLQDFIGNPDINPFRTLTPDFFLKIWNGFLFHIYEGAAWESLLAAAVCILGAAAYARDRDKSAIVFFAFWSVLPSVVLLTSRTDIQPILSTRHFAFLFIPGVLLAARGLGLSLEKAVGLFVPARSLETVTAVLGLLAVLGVAGTHHDRYEEQFHRDIGQSRNLLWWLSRDPRLGESLRYLGYKRDTMRFEQNWTLSGRFLPPGDWDAPAYRREYLAETTYSQPGRMERELPGVPIGRYGKGIFKTRVNEAGLVNRSPVVLSPGPDGRFDFIQKFSDLSYTQDCYQSRNFSPDSEVGLLRPDRYSQPAWAVYAFEIPPGSSVRDVAVTLRAQAYKRNVHVPFDSTLEVLASADGVTYESLGKIGQESFDPASGGEALKGCEFFEELSFYDTCLFANRKWDITPLLNGSGKVFVKIVYTPGVVEGFLNIAGFSLSGGIELPAGGGARAALTLQARNLARNVRTVPWRKGGISGMGAYAFATEGSSWLSAAVPGLNPPEALADFLKENPGSEPVYELKDERGAVAVRVYDPQLGTAGIPLDARAPEAGVSIPDGESLKVAGLVLAGKIASPVLEVGGRRMEIPVITPAGSVLSLNLGGKARLTFQPDFLSGAAGMDTYEEQNIAVSKHPDYRGGLTCLPYTNCHFSYLFVSAFPIERLRIRYYPRLYGLAGDPGQCRVSYSIDGKNFIPLDEQKAARNADWTLMHDARMLSVRFDKVVRQVQLRFELQANENAELWAHTRPTDAMWIEADLRGVWLEPFEEKGPVIPVKLENGAGNDFRLHLSEKPLQVRDSSRTDFFKK